MKEWDNFILVLPEGALNRCVDPEDWVRKEVLAATVELREKNKPAPEPAKPTETEILTSILEELQKQNKTK